MIQRGTGQLRLLHAIRIKANLLPSQFGKLTPLEQKFVRQSVLVQIEEENRR